MDSRDRASVAAFFDPQTPVASATLELGESAAHHARVRRLAEGDLVRTTDGRGTLGVGSIVAIRHTGIELFMTSVGVDPAPPLLTLLVPIADRERMLALAEKVAEFGVSIWQPVNYARSRSVSPRGVGEAFAGKVRARMVAALEQSRGAWLPEIRPERSLEELVATIKSEQRFVLEPTGHPLVGFAPFNEVAVAFGPEGGLESAELDLLLAHGWRTATLGRTILRFETAGIAAAAIIRASQVS